MLEAGRELLQCSGFEHYEVSNFCRPGRECLHNLMVWQGYPYLGLGPWAHSMAVGRDPQVPTLRLVNPDIERYYAGELVAGALRQLEGARLDAVAWKAAREEFLYLALRTSRGTTEGDYFSRFHTSIFEDFKDSLSFLIPAGLVWRETDRLAPTARGMFFADEIALRLSAGQGAPA
jgi:oxygen-independent coproporphyrinogen-3 oxidase